MEAEHDVLCGTAESSNKIAAEAAVAVINSRNNLFNVQRENILLKRKIVSLEAKIVSFSSNTEANQPATTEDDSYKKFEEHLVAVNKELELEREVNVKLRSDIASLLTLQSCLTKPLDDDPNEIAEQQSKPDIAEPDEPFKIFPMEEGPWNICFRMNKLYLFFCKLVIFFFQTIFTNF